MANDQKKHLQDVEAAIAKKMIDIIYEEMDDQVTNMILARLSQCSDIYNRRHPEAEKVLIDWFASKGINLIIKGWENWYDEKSEAQ